ncbi:MAG: DUF4123 domain-containing protein [Polyangiaceae bacterium]
MSGLSPREQPLREQPTSEQPPREQLPRVLLEIRGGGASVPRAVIAPGDRLRVGRTTLSEIVVAADDHLSQVHWEIAWDGARCEVRDLGGAGGLFVGGEPRESAEVRRTGTWLRAGRTDFLVHFEDTREAPPGEAAVESLLARLRIESTKGHLFALLDAARDDRVLRLLRTSVDDHQSLYEGLTAETMADGAPYLVRLREGSRLLPRLVREGWGQSWGIALTSRAPLRDLRAHFRRLLTANREDGGPPMYFRFYDPRVLRAFLPLATPRQVDLFFGPVDRFLIESEKGIGIHLFKHQSGRLTEEDSAAWTTANE